MVKQLFGGSEARDSSNSGYGALPPSIQQDIRSVSGVGRQLVQNADQFFRPMGFTSEELMAQRMINPENLAQTVGAYLNPYRDIITQDINKQFEAPQSALASRAAEAGAFGGSRMRGSQADLERSRFDSIANAMSGQWNNAFGQAQQGIQNLLGFGGFERGLDLAQRGALAQAFNVASGGQGLGFLPGTSQSQGREDSYDGMFDGAGGMMAFLSDRRLKTNIEKVGEKIGLPLYEFEYLWSPQKFIGFMADEVEKLYPDAVGEVDGFKYVDYGVLNG